VRTLIAVALGGALGCTLRYLTSVWFAGHWPRHFYLGTFAVNIVGCLAIGYLFGIFLVRTDIPVELRIGLVSGVLGGLTTFSSFSLEVVRLLEGGQYPLALAYLAASIGGGLFATWAGLSFARL
jgi:CrcB protein